MAQHGAFELVGGVGFCNAVRRALLSDIEAWAPCEVVMRANTSAQNDEYLAHRIGLIPFSCQGSGGGELTLRATGPCTVTADMFTGPGFTSVHGGIEVVVLADARQRVDMTVRFDKQVASKHARYATCAGVGMEAAGAHHVLRFTTNDGEAPRKALNRALDALDARVGHALRELASEAPPPQSMC